MFRVIHKNSCVITYLLGVEDAKKKAVILHEVKSIFEGVSLFRKNHPSEKIISVVLQTNTR